MKNSLLSDDEFLAAFESATLADFHHSDHIRAAWIYLRRLPFPQAAERMAESLRRFAASKGAHQKYHETITQAWMLLVSQRLTRTASRRQRTSFPRPDARRAPPALSTADAFDAFAAAHPELLDAHALERFYSSQLLASAAARTRFVPPDLTPLPGPESCNS